MHEIDIFNIDIFLLASEYLNYLKQLSFRDLNEAGDFLQMAATLIELKSRRLLPSEVQSSEDKEEVETDINTLRDRLVEYEVFRKLAQFFEQVGANSSTVFTAYESERLAPDYEGLSRPLESDVASLCIMYCELLKDLAYRVPESTVIAKTHLVSVEEKIIELEKLIEKLKFALFQGFYKNFRSRYELTVYILAMLELVKNKTIHLHQADLFGPIWLLSRDSSHADLPLTPKEKEALLT